MAKVEQLLMHLRVLVVEDELDIAELLVFVLEESGAVVKLATTAQEALSLLKDYQPDILVSNIRLPDQDGDWLIRQVHAQSLQQKLPAIAVSSYNREISRRHMLQAGFHQFLHKPLDPDELIAEVLNLTNGNLSNDGS